MTKEIQMHLIHYMEKAVAHFAYQDMLRAQGKTKSRKIKPYSLGDDTLEAKEFLDLAHAGTNEEEIKGYVMKLRITRNLHF